MPDAKINNVKIHYEIHGDEKSEKAIVFLNGVASSVNSWYNIIIPFVNSGFKVILHDFRGQLLSEKPKGPYSFEQNALDLKALLDHIGIKKTHVVGISYGGIVASRFAIMNPESIQTLTMLNSLYAPDAKMRFVDRAIVQRIENMEIKNVKQYFMDLIPNSYSPEYLSENEDAIIKRLDDVVKLPVEFLYSQLEFCKAFLTDNFDKNNLKNIKCPVLLVASEKDVISPEYYSRDVLKLIPHSEFIKIPDCGHASFVEKPEVVKTIVYGFIAKNSLNRN